MNRRVEYIDLAGGILIIWIIIFHAINGCKVFGDTDARVALPYLTFSMPWFFYKSGQFTKKGIDIKREVEKLLIPFLKWSAAGYCAYLIVLLVGGTLSPQTGIKDVLHTFYIYGYVTLNVPAWFVLSLFFVRVISGYLIKHSVSPYLCIAAGIAFGYGFHLLDNPHLPFYTANVAMGIAFYMIGYKFARFESNKPLSAVCLAGYVAFLLFGCSIVGHHRNILLAGHFLLWPLFAYCGIVTFNNICRLTDERLSRSPLRDFRPITFIGRNTMTLLVTHAFVYFPIQRFSTLPPWQTAGIIFAGYILLLTPLLLAKRKAERSQAHS